MSFSYAPIRFMTYVGILFDVFAFIMLISVLVEYFTQQVPIAGWSSLMCVVLFSAGLILSMLGMLGEYLWRTLDASRKRPPFIIEETIDSTIQKMEQEKSNE